MQDIRLSGGHFYVMVVKSHFFEIHENISQYQQACIAKLKSLNHVGWGKHQT